jgi:hypothetical protein
MVHQSLLQRGCSVSGGTRDWPKAVEVYNNLTTMFPVDLERLLHPTTGDGDRFFLHHAGNHVLGFLFSHQRHAAMDAISLLPHPAALFRVVLRGTYLIGGGMEILWPKMLAMAALGISLLTIAVLRFHKALD